MIERVGIAAQWLLAENDWTQLCSHVYAKDAEKVTVKGSHGHSSLQRE